MSRYLSFLIVILSTALSLTGTIAETFTICTGPFAEKEKGNKCDPYDIFVYPSLNGEKIAAEPQCKARGASGKPLLVRMKAVPGGCCGYDTIRVFCR